MMQSSWRPVCLAISALAALMVSGCATVQRSIRSISSTTSLGFNESPVEPLQLETAERLAKLHANILKLGEQPQPFGSGTMGMSVAEQQTLVSRLTELIGDIKTTQAVLESRSHVKLAELARLERQYGRQRGTLTVAGGGMSVISLALLAANPAANAGLIALLSGTSTGLLAFQATRAEEGLTGRQYHERAEKISAVWTLAVASFYKGLGQAETGLLKLDLHLTSQGVQEMLNAQATEAAALASDLAIMVGRADGPSVVGDALPSRAEAGKLAQKSALDDVIKRLQHTLIGVTGELATKKAQSDAARAIVDNPEAETTEVQAARVDFAMLEKDLSALTATKRLLEQQILDTEKQITALGL